MDKMDNNLQLWKTLREKVLRLNRHRFRVTTINRILVISIKLLQPCLITLKTLTIVLTGTFTKSETK